jgi:hypothetical protein
VDLLIGDPTKAMTKLGWTPKYDLPMLVNDMVTSDVELFRREKLLKDLSRADVIVVAEGSNLPEIESWPQKILKKFGKPALLVNLGGGDAMGSPVSSYVAQDGKQTNLNGDDGILGADIFPSSSVGRFKILSNLSLV